MGVRRYSNTLLGSRALLSCLILLSTTLSLYPSPAAADRSTYRYHQAEACYQKLLKDPKRQKYRHYWLLCIKRFCSVYKKDPNGACADAALFMVGKLYYELYRLSGNIRYREEARDYWSRVVNHFPEREFRAKAEACLTSLGKGKYAKKRSQVKKFIPARIPKKKSVLKKRRQYSLRKSGPKKVRVIRRESAPLVEVAGMRFWSNPKYTRVVIDLKRKVHYTYHLLREDPSLKKPQRLFLDLKHTRLSDGVRPIIPIGDDLLIGARAAQHRPDTVRVVLDIKYIDSFKIFSLYNPFRIIVDVRGEKERKPPKRETEPGKKPPGVKKPPISLVKQLALGVRRIVIDPGHGGEDFGAPGYLKGVYEKYVVMDIARRVATKIRSSLGCDVILTRNGDTFLSLEERTAIANTSNADIFISIHTNASKNRTAAGIETYFLNLATDNDAVRVAARENATSTRNISDLETILTGLMRNAKINESRRLASFVQRSLIKRLKPKYNVKDLGVKQAPFYVLLGAEMPSILIEASFISNPLECRRLVNGRYQEELADAIVDGIKDYIKENNPSFIARTQEARKKGGRF
nr:N-acetylmuramoyl-L-alanine amidase [Desulfobacterales bacterium]